MIRAFFSLDFMKRENQSNFQVLSFPMMFHTRGGQLVVKWANGQFSKIGAGGNISGDDHKSNSTISQDTSSTLFVMGFESNMMWLLAKTLN